MDHPGQWKENGFSEIENPPKRYGIIDLQSLSELSGFADLRDFQRAHREWVEQGLENGLLMRDDRWSEAIAVGNLTFVETVKNELGFKASHRDVIESNGSHALREAAEAYGRKFAGENEALRVSKHFPVG